MLRTILFFSASLFLFSCGGGKPDPAQTSKNDSSTKKDIPLNADDALLASPKKLITNKDRALAFFEAIENANTLKLPLVMHEDFTSDHPYFNNGIMGLKQFMVENRTKEFSFDVYRALQQGNTVITHSVYNFPSPMVAIDIFEFEKGKIKSIKGALSAFQDQNGNGHNSVSGSTKVENIAKTGLYLDFTKRYMNEVVIPRNTENISKFVSKDYIDHGSYGKDGIKGLKENINTTKSNLVRNKLEMVSGEGNFVLTVCSGDHKGKPAKIYELVRLDKNKISERWELID